MKVIFNHTLRSIRASKGQLAVIILTVAVVTMLFFATLTVGDLFYNFQVAGFSRLSGDAEIAMDGAIFSGEKLSTSFTPPAVSFARFSMIMLPVFLFIFFLQMHYSTFQ